MIADHHIHTRLCRHASGEPREYVERAVVLGMRELGFADHLPFLDDWRPRHDLPDDWSMSLGELEDYVTLVHDLAGEYSADLHVVLGIEADYLEETLDETAAVLAQYPFDYVIGSVHVVGERFAFDHPALRDRLPEYGIGRIRVESLELAERAADSGLFDVIGHLDHAKKLGGPAGDEGAVGAAASRALRAIAAGGVALEVNTAGLRKPIGEQYPSQELLAEACALGIPITFGSDAHRPEDVGAGFERAVEIARNAGYTTVLSPGGGAPEELP